ncbi:MAG: VacB/RNase II family 3'-5' exoribonuclease [Oscillospiraceae bacterium]|jgi:ribonuclease R|nr:VacB/RNase II family 3'-5' exoribonuclease [Oscillospiraceae bacterium]
MGKKNGKPPKTSARAPRAGFGGNTFEGEIIRVLRTHGFVRDVSTNEEYFVSGRDLGGGIPGDTAIFTVTAPARDSESMKEARLLRVITESGNTLTGTVVDGEYGGLYLKSDSFGSRRPLEISKRSVSAKAGDKVRFTIKRRGSSHDGHVADISAVYGSSSSARVCANAYLEEKGITVGFPDDVLREAEYVCENEPRSPERLDLRHIPVFTIDGEDTKDIDDAVSIRRVPGGYGLGVHIADVSHFVAFKSALDKEAFKRGTSVYIADMVVPMLPKRLSNGICSLNPRCDRAAFSCLMLVGENGELKSFEFKKTIIRSRVQGVYGEVNALLKGEADEAVIKKYAETAGQIPVMAELADILKKNRAEAGSPALCVAESKIICGENGECLDIKRRENGVSEGIIEEFMLLANNAAARLAMKEKLPFVYRVHEPPAAEKTARLSETLNALGISADNLKPTAPSLSAVIEAARGSDKFDVVNMAVLRAMAKARYDVKPLGHFGLVMREYTHFTSPIRRYPDLSVHRILSSFISGEKELKKKYGRFTEEAAAASSETELRAVAAERDCRRFYAAEYMSPRVGEEFDGIISGVTENSVFVMLPNTVEGRVALPYNGGYRLIGDIAVANDFTGDRFVTGDRIRVRCAGCGVPTGTVDFEKA